LLVQTSARGSASRRALLLVGIATAKPKC